MDEMKLTLTKNNLMQTVLAKAISSIIQKKLGCKVNVEVNEVVVTSREGKTEIHLDIDANMGNAEVMRLVKKAGIE
jgi:hypothetical protein